MKIHCVCLLLLGTVLLSCSKPLDQRVLGKWMSEDGQARLEFFVDKTVVMTIGESIGTGTWTVVGDRRIKMEWSPFGPSPTPISIYEDIWFSGTEMGATLNGTRFVWHRAK